MSIRRCIPELSVRDLSTITDFLVRIVGFNYDWQEMDDADPSTQAILVLDDIQLRLYSSSDSSKDCSLVFECTDSKHWRDVLDAEGYAPVYYRDIAQPLAVECQVTPGFRVTFEELD